MSDGCRAVAGKLRPCRSPIANIQTSASRTQTEAQAAKAVTPSGMPSPTPKPAADQPGYGGIVTKSTNRDAASFDVQREQGQDASATLFNVYQGLVRVHTTEHKKIVPELAEKWELSADGRVYTFKFYGGVKWHDGKPLTMEDVKYSLERMHNPKAFNTVSPRGQGLLAAMESAEVVNEDTIRITTKYPSASFLGSLASGWVAIEPKHILVAKGDMRRDLIGTGPFKLKRFNPDISLELEKNPNYHVKGLPYLDGIQFFTIKDAATRFSAFRTGKVLMTFDGSAGLTPPEADIVRREMSDRAVVYEHDSQGRINVTFNMNRKPWNDVRVRKAVDLALDRQAAIRINGNRGVIGSIYVGPWGMKSDELAKLPGYRQPKDADLAEARKLLAEAGYPNGFKTTLVYRTGGATEQQGVIRKDQLARIGIDVELMPMEYAAVLERAQRRNFDLLAINWTDNMDDPDEALYTYYYTGGGRNYGDFSDKEIDALIDKQARTVDAEARKVILAEVQRRIMAQAPMPISFWDVWQTGVWRQVKGYNPGPGIHPWGKLEGVWLAK
ncbi:MAG: ABC transporter substrate-binding protein [Chloroflexi bacterium]|nr:ABC transporter substrate-binding protein [Chloroflexota bacterium]